ncbi:peroxidase 51-like [Panicum miliaceum]|uniref:Peroxidase 51-like n=1 Tax=Panicum miliaceum TaxID=4540 RepID=A0A3L6QP97_PANMI|nr:peroxidase 51-like [Panicum miliaceum]
MNTRTREQTVSLDLLGSGSGKRRNGHYGDGVPGYGVSGGHGEDVGAGHLVPALRHGVSGRLWGLSAPDPTLDRGYAAQLQADCLANVDPRAAVSKDPVTPVTFGNQPGLLASDQVLYTDPRSRPTVNAWAQSGAAFNRAIMAAITKLARVGVKTGAHGNIRRNCALQKTTLLTLHQAAKASAKDMACPPPASTRTARAEGWRERGSESQAKTGGGRGWLLGVVSLAKGGGGGA